MFFASLILVFYALDIGSTEGASSSIATETTLGESSTTSYRISVETTAASEMSSSKFPLSSTRISGTSAEPVSTEGKSDTTRTDFSVSPTNTPNVSVGSTTITNMSPTVERTNYTRPEFSESTSGTQRSSVESTAVSEMSTGISHTGDFNATTQKTIPTGNYTTITEMTATTTVSEGESSQSETLPTKTSFSDSTKTEETTSKWASSEDEKSTPKTEKTSPSREASSPHIISTVSESHPTEKLSTEFPTSEPVSSFECPTRFGLFSDPKKCSMFYHCSNWIPYHKNCPANLHFNQKFKVCDWPEDAGCDTGLDNETTSFHLSSTPEAPSTESTKMENSSSSFANNTATTESLTTPENSTISRTSSENNVTDTSNVNNNTILSTKVSVMNESSSNSPYVTFFNNSREETSEKEYTSVAPAVPVSDRSTSDEFITSRNMKSVTDETTTQILTEFECPTRFGLFADPLSCFKFYDCSHWTAYHKSCPPGLHFSLSYKVCDWPYRAGCLSV